MRSPDTISGLRLGTIEVHCPDGISDICVRLIRYGKICGALSENIPGLCPGTNSCLCSDIRSVLCLFDLIYYSSEAKLHRVVFNRIYSYH